MRKIAAHYLFCEQLFHLHYIQIEEDNTWTDIVPLEQEEAGVKFYNGLIWIVPASLLPEEYPWQKWCRNSPEQTLKFLIQQEQPTNVTPPLFGKKIHLFHFPDLTRTASELCTDNSSSNRYIQRL